MIGLKGHRRSIDRSSWRLELLFKCKQRKKETALNEAIAARLSTIRICSHVVR